MRRAWIAPAAALALAALAGCAAAPAPRWSGDAATALARQGDAYLQGQDRIAEREFAEARSAVAQTARPELVARVELARCALQVASLDFAPCIGYEALADAASPADRAYAHYLAGHATAADVALLPENYRAGAQGALVQAGPIIDPRSRLIAAGVLQRQGRGTPELAALAVDTASHWGWRRPLAAWLTVQADQAQAAGDAGALARIRQRLQVLQTPGR